jgi:hypothetical protein
VAVLPLLPELIVINVAEHVLVAKLVELLEQFLLVINGATGQSWLQQELVASQLHLWLSGVLRTRLFAFQSLVQSDRCGLFIWFGFLPRRWDARSEWLQIHSAFDDASTALLFRLIFVLLREHKLGLLSELLEDFRALDRLNTSVQLRLHIEGSGNIVAHIGSWEERMSDLRWVGVYHKLDHAWATFLALAAFMEVMIRHEIFVWWHFLRIVRQVFVHYAFCANLLLDLVKAGSEVPSAFRECGLWWQEDHIGRIISLAANTAFVARRQLDVLGVEPAAKSLQLVVFFLAEINCLFLRSIL